MKASSPEVLWLTLTCATINSVNCGLLALSTGTTPMYVSPLSAAIACALACGAACKSRN